MGYQESLAHWSMALLQATSISAFARALESVSKNTDEPDRLHCLENRSTGTAVLMILGGCGSPLKFGALKDWYQSLNYTVFGVDASLRPGDFEGLDDLAEELTSQIVRRNWETSPIILGWCTGCRLAVEVTRLLHESGIDAHCVLVNPRTLEKRSQIGNFVRRMTANFRILSRPKMILREQLRLLVTGTIRERLAHVNHVLRVLHALFRFQPWPSPGGFGTDHEAKRREYSRLSRTPLGQYHFPATCFFTSERESIPPKWEPHFSQGITLYPLPGVHETVINHLSNDSCNPLNLWFKGYLKGRRRNALK